MSKPLCQQGVCAACGIALLLLWQPSIAMGARQIGNVSNLFRTAYGTPPEDRQAALRVGEHVVSKEIVETAKDAALHIRFLDGSDFHLGSTSRATLDSFLYDPSSQNGKMTLLLKEGIFRFKTGQMKASGIRVLTPVALITPKGTEFTVQVLASGAMTVAVISGAVTITPLVATSEPRGPTTVTAPSAAQVLTDGTVQGSAQPPAQDDGIELLSRLALLETEGPPVTFAGPPTQASVIDTNLDQGQPTGGDDHGGLGGPTNGGSGNGGGSANGPGGPNGGSGGTSSGAGGSNGGPTSSGDNGDGSNDGGGGSDNGGSDNSDSGHADRSRAGGLDGANPGRGHRGPGVGTNNPSRR